MGFLNKSIILVLLLFTVQPVDRSIGLPLCQDYELVYNYSGLDKTIRLHQLRVYGAIGQQAFSLRSIFLFASIVSCFLFIYAISRVNRLNRKLEGASELSVQNRHLDSSTNSIIVSTRDSAEVHAPLSITARDIKWLEKLDELIENELSNTLLKPIDMAEHMGICERQLQRKLKEIKGISPAKYVKQTRLKMGHEYLKSGEYQTVSEVAYAVGYASPNNFSRAFKSHFGVKPNDLINTRILV